MLSPLKNTQNRCLGSVACMYIRVIYVSVACMYIRVYIRVNIHAHTYAEQMPGVSCMYMYVRVNVCVYIYIYTYKYVYPERNMYMKVTYTCIYACVYMGTYRYNAIHVYTYIYVLLGHVTSGDVMLGRERV